MIEPTAMLNVTSLGRTLLTTLGSVKWPKAGEVIGARYAIIYVVFGLAAVVLWAAKPNESPAALKGLAGTFLGLALPIVRGGFQPPQR